MIRPHLCLFPAPICPLLVVEEAVRKIGWDHQRVRFLTEPFSLQPLSIHPEVVLLSSEKQHHREDPSGVAASWVLGSSLPGKSASGWGAPAYKGI